MRNRPPAGRGRRSAAGPGRHIGFRVFGFLLFVLLVSAVIGGLIAWLATPRRGAFLLIGLGVIVAFVLIMRSAFRRNWAPVSDLIDATTRLGEGDTDVRMRSYGRGPWVPIASSFNNMADRLAEEDDRRRRLLADLGHELRTPLSVIRGEIEAVLDGVHTSSELANVVDEVGLMERLLEDLRTLALAESGSLELITEPVHLGDLVADVVASYRATAHRQGVSVEMSISTGGEVEVDPHRLHQVLANLISNALAQMPDGGTLKLWGSNTTISIADTGPGIPEQDLPMIFDRFHKAADSSGSGLGLSIARDLVEAHGGTLSVANRHPRGAVFTIELG